MCFLTTMYANVEMHMLIILFQLQLHQKQLCNAHDVTFFLEKIMTTVCTVVYDIAVVFAKFYIYYY